MTENVSDQERRELDARDAEQHAAFSDEKLLANGFEEVGRTLRKHVGPAPTETPVMASRSLLEEMSHPIAIQGDATTDQARRQILGLSPVKTVVPRSELLREAEQLITGDRNETYGTPTQNFENIAGLWNIQFRHMLKPGVSFTGAHVAQAQIHVKQARLIAQPKRDNYVDIAGYAACGWEAQVASGGAQRKPVGIEFAYLQAGMSWEEIDKKAGRS